MGFGLKLAVEPSSPAAQHITLCNIIIPRELGSWRESQEVEGDPDLGVLKFLLANSEIRLWWLLTLFKAPAPLDSTTPADSRFFVFILISTSQLVPRNRHCSSCFRF